MLRGLVRNLDALIRRTEGVFEFTTAPDCLLRLQKAKLKRTLRLPAETLEAGTEVMLLHLWNERLPRLPPAGADLAWTKKLQRDFGYSLQTAAAYLAKSSDLAQVRAVGGATSLVGEGTGGGRFLQRLGFSLLPAARPLGDFGAFWETFYARLLVWTFNPTSLRSKRQLRLERIEFWMTRADFLRRFSL